jgi:serine/threonine protein kinase
MQKFILLIGILMINACVHVGRGEKTLGHNLVQELADKTHKSIDGWVLAHAGDDNGSFAVDKDTFVKLEVLRNEKGEDLSGSSGKLFKVKISYKNTVEYFVAKIVKPNTYNKSAEDNFRWEKEINRIARKHENADDLFLAAISIRPHSMLFLLANGTLKDLGKNFDARKVQKEIAEALAALASLNVVHNDIKPGNIFYFISANGDKKFVLGDFGGSRLVKDIPKGSSYSGIDKEIIRNGKSYYVAYDLSFGLGKTFAGDQLALKLAIIDQKFGLSDLIFAEVEKRTDLKENAHTFANQKEILNALAKIPKAEDPYLNKLIEDLKKQARLLR